MLSILPSEDISEKAENVWFSCLKPFTGTHRIKFKSLHRQASVLTPANYPLVTYSQSLQAFQFSLPEYHLLLVNEEVRISFQDLHDITTSYLI